MDTEIHLQSMDEQLLEEHVTMPRRQSNHSSLSASHEMPDAGLLPLDEATPDSDVTKLSCMDVLRTMGPGIMVCLADTDGPCLITAAQSGALFGYSLLLVQLVLIPVLFMAQELTVRLGLFTGRGLTELVRDTYGQCSAMVLCVLVVVICVGAIISEIVCIAQVGEMFGLSLTISALSTAILLAVIVVSAGYKTVEKIGVLMGACQLVFIPLAFLTKPNWHDLWMGLWDYSSIIHSSDEATGVSAFMGLLAANIGAVIMPWMLLYQQSAICGKTSLRQSKEHLRLARIDTGVGSILTQLVMSAMVVSIAAASAGSTRKIAVVQDIMTRVEDYSGGPLATKIILSTGMVGASLTAALVVSLCAAWCVAEAAGAPRSLDLGIRRAPTVYIGYFAVLAAGVLTTLALGKEAAVNFNIGVQILNAFTMPVFIGFLFVLASKAQVLPDHVRLTGWYKWIVFTVFLVVSVFSVVAGSTGNLG